MAIDPSGMIELYQWGFLLMMLEAIRFDIDTFQE